MATGEPFDPATFRYELLHAIEQKFQEFKEELAVALENTEIPSYPHVVDEPQSSKKQSILDIPISSWLDKPLFKKEK